MPEAAPGAAPTAAPGAATARDPRLDVLRGAALLTIFVNHVPGNAYEALTLRNWGFSDAAEAFVLMAGVSAGLAHGPAFAPGGRPWRGLARLWGRAWTLYLVHLLITALALGIAAGLALWAGAPGLLAVNGIDVVLRRPLEASAAMPLLLHQLDYADILPLYALLLLAAPGLLWLGCRAPRALLLASLALWALSGTGRLNLPTWPVAGGWFLSPVSWQVLFVVGLMTGTAMRRGRRLVPRRGWLLGSCGAFLLLALAWRVVPGVGMALNGALGRLGEAGAPWVLTAFHKTWETAPRLLHALSLAYVLSALPAVKRLCAGRGARPLALLGRHSLPVFALGSVLAILLQGIRAGTGPDLLRDTLMLGAGVALMLALAAARDRAAEARA